MKKYFIVSLIKNGIIGGSIIADSEGVTFHTGKLTVSEKYRHLEMKYENICKITPGWLFVLPTVLIEMQNGEKFKFAVFFGRQRFVDTIEEKSEK